jgi:hypothetical protein
VFNVPRILPDIFPALVPYTPLLASFGGFVVWNGGVVLGTSTALPWSLAAIEPSFSRGQVESRRVAPHPTVVLLHRVCDGNGLACSGQWGWRLENVKGRSPKTDARQQKVCVLIVNACCEDLKHYSLIRRVMLHVAASVAMGLSIKLFTYVQVMLKRSP